MLFDMRETVAIDDGAKVRRTRDGYLVARPRVARTGIQLYRGTEVGKADKEIVRVYRPADEVFHADALKSMAHRPLTNDHPPVPVTADNWKQYAVGQTADEVARDGEFVRVPLMFTDGETIRAFESGKAELSVGYSCSLDFVDGKTADGESYDAIQRNIRVNHVALVERARGGEKLRVGDAATINTKDYSDALVLIGKGSITRGTLNDATLFVSGTDFAIGTKDAVNADAVASALKTATADNQPSIVDALTTLLKHIDGAKQPEIVRMNTQVTTTMIDGVAVQMDAQTAAIVNRHLQRMADDFEKITKAKKEAEEEADKKQKKDAETITELSTKLATADAQVVTLTKQVADAKVTPEMLDAMVKERAVIGDMARFVMGDKASTLVVDGKAAEDIRKQAVLSRLGDASTAGWNDTQFAASFATLTAGYTPPKAGGVQDLARVWGGDSRTVVTTQTDSAMDSYLKRNKEMADAYKTAGPAAA